MSYQNDEQERKIFVGGFSKENTDEDDLKAYFERYGGIIDCTILRDSEMKRSRGFGFILFNDAETVDKIMRIKKTGTRFTLDDGNSYIEVRRALPKSSHDGKSRDRSSFQSRPTSLYNKIFVGGLPSVVTEDELSQYFENFGRIKQIELIHDKETRRFRGFAFVTFDDDDSADKCLQRRSHEICKKMVEVKRAVIKEKDSYDNSNYSGHRGADSFNNHDSSKHNSIQAPTSTNLGSDINALIQQAFLMGQQSVYQQAGLQPPTLGQLSLPGAGSVNPIANLTSAVANPLLQQAQQQQTNYLLLQALAGQQVAPVASAVQQQMVASVAPVVPAAPVPAAPVVSNSNDTLGQLAQLLHQNGVDPSTLGALLKNESPSRQNYVQQQSQSVQQQQPQQQPVVAATSNNYSTVYPGIYNQSSSSYNPSPTKHDEHKRQYRPY